MQEFQCENMLYVNLTILIYLKALHAVRDDVTSGKKITSYS